MYRGNINRCYVFNMSVVCGNKETANIYSGDGVEWLLWKQTHSCFFFVFSCYKRSPRSFPTASFLFEKHPISLPAALVSSPFCRSPLSSQSIFVSFNFHPSSLGGRGGKPTCSTLMKLSSLSFNCPTLRHPETALLSLSLPAANVCFPNKCRAECWGRWHPPTRGANAPNGAALTSTGIKYMRHYWDKRVCWTGGGCMHSKMTSR